MCGRTRARALLLLGQINDLSVKSWESQRSNKFGIWNKKTGVLGTVICTQFPYQRTCYTNCQSLHGCLRCKELLPTRSHLSCGCLHPKSEKDRRIKVWPCKPNGEKFWRIILALQLLVGSAKAVISLLTILLPLPNPASFTFLPQALIPKTLPPVILLTVLHCDHLFKELTLQDQDSNSSESLSRSSKSFINSICWLSTIGHVHILSYITFISLSSQHFK